jgi:DNA replication protein DnaC
MRLPHLTNEQAEEVALRAEPSGISPDMCPTCLSTPEGGERVNGVYKLDGVEHPCDCETQVILRKHYLLANIPDQYIHLDWKADFDGSPKAQEAVDIFLERWPSFKRNGMGVEFASRGLGVGKTFAATTLGKELVKRGEKVLFCQFREAIQGVINGDTVLEGRLRNTNVVILDEVIAPYTDKQKKFFADRFETIIRHRTNYNGVTIMTTNLSEAEIKEHYERTYSLLSAKQMRVDMTGEDVRPLKIGSRNLELVMNGETRPIT